MKVFEDFKKLYPVTKIFVVTFSILAILLLINDIQHIKNKDYIKTEIKSDFLCYNAVTNKQIECNVEKIEWDDGNVTFSINLTQ